MHPARPAHQDNNGLGVSLYIAELVLITLIALLVKHLGATFPFYEILFCRFVFALPLIAVQAYRETGAVLARPVDTRGVAVRVCSGILGLGTYFYALTVIPLADVSALAYTSPIFVTLLSIPLLGEKVGPRRWSAVVAGFFGMVLITRPGSGLVEVGAIAAAVSALFAAMVSIQVRRLSRTENPARVAFYYNAVGALVMGTWCLVSGAVMPAGALEITLLVGLGAIASGQQLALAYAHKFAEASLLAPLNYIGLVLAIAAGYAFWREIPSPGTWAGSAIIAASGLFIIYREIRSKGHR